MPPSRRAVASANRVTAADAIVGEGRLGRPKAEENRATPQEAQLDSLRFLAAVRRHGRLDGASQYCRPSVWLPRSDVSTAGRADVALHGLERPVLDARVRESQLSSQVRTRARGRERSPARPP